MTRTNQSILFVRYNREFVITEFVITEFDCICSLKKKKGSGSDGLTQEQLLLGAKALAAPLTRLINSSITSGVFQEA